MPFVPLTFVDKIPYQEILDYASKITKYTSPDPHWDPTRPQQPGFLSSPPKHARFNRPSFAWVYVSVVLTGRNVCAVAE